MIALAVRTTVARGPAMNYHTPNITLTPVELLTPEQIRDWLNAQATP